MVGGPVLVLGATGGQGGAVVEALRARDVPVQALVRDSRTASARRLSARVPHLVFSSVAGATAHTGVPHFDSKAAVEADLAAADLPLPSGRPLQQLARPGLGRFAADVLRNPGPYTGRRIELASDAPTPAQMADALTAATGHQVVHRTAPVDAIDNEDMRRMWRFLNGAGYQVDLTALHAAHPDVGWTPFTAWARATFRRG